MPWESVVNKIDFDIPYLELPKNKRRAEWIFNKILPIIRYKANCTLGCEWLDVGAGDGGYMRELIRKTNRLKTSEVDLDVDRYEFGDGKFDLVTSIDVIEHLYNPLFHLLEVRRILKDDGILILNTCNDYSLIYKVEHLLSRKYKGHFHQFSKFDLRCILKRAGFKILEFRKYFRPTSGTIARISQKEFIIVCQKDNQ